jgi:hypothetical protein
MKIHTESLKHEEKSLSESRNIFDVIKVVSSVPVSNLSLYLQCNNMSVWLYFSLNDVCHFVYTK